MLASKINERVKLLKENLKDILIDANFSELERGVELLISCLKQYVEEFHEIPGHELEHTFRVLELSLFLGKVCNADLRVLIYASLLHDIGRFLKSKLDHAKLSADIARKLLKNHFPDEFINKVIVCIREHSYSEKKKPSSLESAILQDADRLDALGAIGIARVFSYGGYLGRPIYEMGRDIGEGGSVGHFYDKILKLHELMNTEIAKVIAKERTEFIKKFLERLKKEVKSEDVKQIMTHMHMP